MPIYAIKNNETGQLRLVEAKRPISAVNHVVGTMFTVSEADARDGVELGRQGGTVEVAGQSAEDIEEERQRYHNSVAKLVGEEPPYMQPLRPMTDEEREDHRAAVAALIARPDDADALDPDRLREDRDERRDLVAETPEFNEVD